MAGHRDIAARDEPRVGPSKAEISYEKTVTINDLLHIAGEIHRHTQTAIRHRKIKFGDSAAAAELMANAQGQYPQFCKSYPVVTRYICEMHEYSARAFRRWLTKISTHPWHSEAEYLDAQADYVVMLFKVKKPRANKTEAAHVRANIRAQLQREHDTFKSTVEELSAAIDKEAAKRADKNAQELAEFIGAAGSAGMAPAGTIRVEPCIGSGATERAACATLSGTRDDHSADACIETLAQLEITAGDLLS